MKQPSILLSQEDDSLVLVAPDVLLDAAGVESPQEVDPPKPSADPAQSDDEAPDSPRSVSGDQPPEAPERSTRPDEVPADEWERRRVAVRELAREFEPAGEGDVREFLEARTNRKMSDEEVKAFEKDVTIARSDDIADALDAQMRSSVDQLKRSRRTVRVSAPRGWLKKSINGLSDEGLAHIVSQLVSRGHNSDSIDKKLMSRVTDEQRRERLAKLLPDDGTIEEEK